MSVIGIIQARMGSSRLPGKILAPIVGRPMLEVIAQRLRASRVSQWWLATSDQPSDDVTEAWGHSLGLRVYRGDQDDVLSRFTAILREERPEWMVRVTGDNPFVSGEAVDLLLDARDEAGKELPLIEFAGDPKDRRTLPLGFGPQLARADAVLESEAEIPAQEAHHRAHVVSWLARDCDPKVCPVPGDWPARPGWRFTVDTSRDLAMARSAFALFGPRALCISYPEMVRALDPHPEIIEMNAGVEQKALEAG
ncbi:MAG: NTP transferase domain-containing protein [Myxococcota bacterium]|jgi:spore coat polysaccharide biosynthesis protein SpsF|nr:NTP transferase domain-containing protein [Myxococcota bacterium]